MTVIHMPILTCHTRIEWITLKYDTLTLYFISSIKRIRVRKRQKLTPCTPLRHMTKCKQSSTHSLVSARKGERRQLGIPASLFPKKEPPLRIKQLAG